MGIYAAAKALNLGFIPIVQEQYDLIIPHDIVETSMMQKVLKTISDPSFKKRVEALGGYDASQSGDLWKEVGWVINKYLKEKNHDIDLIKIKALAGGWEQ